MSDAVYPWAKALHVAAAITFAGGLIVDSLTLAILRQAPDARLRETSLTLIRRWHAVITTPAMLMVWLLGFWLALEGGWFRSGWLPTKLVFVLGLSALHGLQSGMMRRMAAEAHVSGGLVGDRAALLVLASVIVIACLAVAKPY